MGNTESQQLQQKYFKNERNIINQDNTQQQHGEKNFQRSQMTQTQNYESKTTNEICQHDDNLIQINKPLINLNSKTQRQIAAMSQRISDQQTVRNISILAQIIQKEKKDLDQQWRKAYIKKENQLQDLKKEYEKCKEKLIQTKREDNLKMKKQENNQLAKLKQTIKEQQNQIENLSQNLQIYQKQISTHFTTISQLSSQLSNTNIQLQIKNNQLISLKQEILKLQAKVQQNQQRNIENQLSISHLNKIINEVKQKNEIIQQTNMKLKDQVKQKTTTITNSIKNTNKLLTEKYELECQITKLRKQMKNMYTNDHHELSKQCIKQQYQNQMNFFQKENKQLKRKIEGLNKQKNKLLMDVVNLKKEVMRNISCIVDKDNKNQNDQSILNSTDHFFTDLIKEWEQIEQKQQYQQQQSVVVNHVNQRYFKQEMVEDVDV